MVMSYGFPARRPVDFKAKNAQHTSHNRLSAAWNRRVAGDFFEMEMASAPKTKGYETMDWFKGKSTGNHGFYHQI